ncbi:hypothetical protein B296_00007890 [Ensete ventricosum]|uniref:Uncharacterized protein n=1 Tax=Ensete ventricosum TaxID=4639 RepID=A0A427A414_ENSVE|nr:hypothetical protein B296_00007890 [Ensete ventricosum]
MSLRCRGGATVVAEGVGTTGSGEWLAGDEGTAKGGGCGSCYGRKGGKEDYGSGSSGWKSHRKQRRLDERAAIVAGSWQRRQARNPKRAVAEESDRGGGDSGREALEEGSGGGERDMVADDRSRGQRRAWLRQRKEKVAGSDKGCGSERAAGSGKDCGSGRVEGSDEEAREEGEEGAVGAAAEEGIASGRGKDSEGRREEEIVAGGRGEDSDD